MDFELTPKLAPKKLFAGDGGSYHLWAPSDFPLLKNLNLGAAILLLNPAGFALPHCADSSKLGYVLQGEGIAGMVLDQSSKEEILPLSKGDILPVPTGGVSWWFNSGDSDLVILFIGDTSNGYVPGEFTYFFLTGTQGIFSAFTPELMTGALCMEQQQASAILDNQNGTLIIKLPPQEAKNITHLQISSCVDKFVKKMVSSSCCKRVLLTGAEFDFLEKVGLSCSLIKLEADELLSPSYTANSKAVQVFYVVAGKGKVEIVGMNGKLVLDTEVEAGKLLVVPTFFTVAMIAGQQGMELFSVLTTSKPVIKGLTTKDSALNAISLAVVQSMFAVSPELIQEMKSKINI